MKAVGQFVWETYLGTYRKIVFPFRAFLLIRTFLRTGGIEIYTPFSYQGNKLAFRTIIQPDADVLYYIPNLVPYQNQPDIYAVVAQYRAQHLQKIEDIFTALNSPKGFFEKTIDFVLITTNASIAFQTFAQTSQESILMSAGIVGASILFRRFGKKALITFTLKSVISLIKRFSFLKI